jgi:hypothetical protein
MTIMQDFLLIIRTEGDVWTTLSPAALKQHLERGTTYIGGLMRDGVLKSAQPVSKGSRILVEHNGIVKDGPFNETKEVIAGYFLITAENIDEAVVIAKANPIFSDIPSKIEIHPLMAIPL